MDENRLLVNVLLVISFLSACLSIKKNTNGFINGKCVPKKKLHYHFCRYLHYHFVGKNFTDRFMDENRLSVNVLLVISFLSAFFSIKKNTNGFTNGKCVPKKKLPALIYRRNHSVNDW